MSIKKQMILVVDDLVDWRKTLRGMLIDSGYAVQVASTMRTALKMLEKHHFNLALIDIRLDETDENNTEGLDLALEIKHRSKTTKIIMITGYDTPDTVRRAMEPQGNNFQRLATDFIRKTDTDKLIETIQKVLS